MARALLRVLAALLLTAGPARAAEVSVGPPANSARAWVSLGTDSWTLLQSFRTPTNAVFLNSLTLSFAPLGEWQDYHFTNLFLIEGDGPNWDAPNLWSGASIWSGGIQTFDFNHLAVRPDAMYTFVLYTDMDWPAAEENGAEPIFPYRYVEVALGNTYKDGSFYNGNDFDDRVDDMDIFFRADFTTAPEPVSMALLGTGLAGVVAARRRRRRELSPEA